MLALVLCAALLAGETPSERIDAFLSAELASRGVPGVSVAVVKDGVTVFEKGYGLANIELGVAADADTVYELLSASKQFTAALVVMLSAEQKLSLDAHVTELLPDLPSAWSAVTVAELLSHTSGIPDYTDQHGWLDGVREARTPREIVDGVAALPLLFAPGSRWRYSNTNYYLLGLLIEKTAGARFEDELARRLFVPLAMQSAQLESFERVTPHRAAGYHRGRQGLVNAPWIDPSQKWAAGACVASAHDLARWAGELEKHALLAPELHARLLAPAPLSGGGEASYGFANELGRDRGHRRAGHQGGGPGFNTTLLHYPDDGLCVIVLANLTQAPSRLWARRMASCWMPDLDGEEPAIADPEPKFTEVFRGLLAGAAQGKVDGELFAPAVRAEQTAFIERVGPQFLGPQGELRSLEALAARSGATARTLRYRARFAKGTILWTVELDAAGKIESLEPED